VGPGEGRPAGVLHVPRAPGRLQGRELHPAARERPGLGDEDRTEAREVNRLPRSSAMTRWLSLGVILVCASGVCAQTADTIREVSGLLDRLGQIRPNPLGGGLVRVPARAGAPVAAVALIGQMKVIPPPVPGGPPQVPRP